MKMQLDMKSAAVGLVSGVLIAFAVGAASSSGGIGRFQMAGTREQGLIIDTATGQVWSNFFIPGQGTTDPTFFQPKLGEKK